MSANSSVLKSSYQALTSKNVHFKELTGGVLSQTPLPRSCTGAYVFPGSKSPHSQVLFIAETLDKGLLLVVYSKLLTFKAYEYDRALAKASELNSAESCVFWKIEQRAGAYFPLAEMRVFPCSAGLVTEDLIWKACGVIDSVFKAKAEEFKEETAPQDLTIQTQVKTFLQYLGFKKIKEKAIAGGISYLIVLSNDEDGDEETKRFPLKIEVTSHITFRIYFSLSDATVTSRDRFQSSSKSLIARINSYLSVGFFEYAHSTDQIQLVFRLQYQGLSAADTWQSMRVYYDTIIQYYKWTLPALVQLYHDAISATTSVSDVSLYMCNVNEEVYGSIIQKVLEYSNEEEELYRSDIEMMKRLENLGKDVKVTISAPIFRLQEGKLRIVVNVDRQLISFVDHFDKYPYTRDELLLKTISLSDALQPIDVFPTLSMLFCTPPPNLSLLIIPGKGLHTVMERFLDEIMCFSMDRFSAFTTTELCAKPSDFLYQSSDGFTSLGLIKIGGSTVLTASLGGDQYLFHEFSVQGMTDKFSVELVEYQSQLGQLPWYPNIITGWTSFTEECLSNTFNSSDYAFGSDSFCVIERYSLKRWEGETMEGVMIAVAKAALDLHSMNCGHFFISPYTIRLNPITERVTLVFPCLRTQNLEFVSSIVSKEYTQFIAPEVLRHLRYTKETFKSEKADVYSICKVIERMNLQYVKRSSIPASVTEVVDRGLQEDPESRPTIQELITVLEAITHNRLPTVLFLVSLQ